MNKTYQIIETALAAGEVKTVSLPLRNDYEYATGIFFHMRSGVATGTSVRVRIADDEVLPKGSDVTLFTIMPTFSRGETLWDFTKDNVKARSNQLTIEFDNTKGEAKTIATYVLLKND